MSYEGQDHHPHRRGYPPSSDLLLASQQTVPYALELVQAHWFVRHGERAPVRQRMVGLGEIPAVFSLCSVGRNFTSAVLTLAPSPSSGRSSSSLSSSPSPSSPFLASSRHTTSLAAPHPHSSSRLEREPRQMPVTRFTQDVSSSSSSTPSVGGSSDCYWGELTDLGRESTLRFGAILRELYTAAPERESGANFLPRELDADMLNDHVVSFRSTNMPRTIESLHQVVEGLYPQSSSRRRDLRVPYLVRNWMDENLYPNTACKKLRQLDAVSIRQAAARHNPELEALDPVLVPVLGAPLRIDSSPRASGVLDTLMVCRAHGIEVPRVFEDRRVLETLETAVVHEWFDGYKNPEFRRLAMGRLFSDLHAHLSAKVSPAAAGNNNNDALEEAKLKLAINSCHDTSLGGILNALDAFNGRWPPFCSTIGIELYKSNRHHHQKDDDDRSSIASTSGPRRYEDETVNRPASSSSLASSLKSLLPSTSSARDRPSHYVRVLYNGRALSLPGCAATGDHLDEAGDDDDREARQKAKTWCTWEAFARVLDEVKMDEKEWVEACGGAE